MAEKGGLGGFKRAAALSREHRSRPEVLRSAWAAAYFVLGFAASAARLFGGGAPFGLAMVSCAGGGISGVAALVGAALGYFAAGGVEWGIKYVAACVLAFTTAFVFMETRVYEKVLFRPLVAGIVMAVTGFLGTFIAEAGAAPGLAVVAVEAVFAFGGCLFFTQALNGEPPTSEAAEIKYGACVMLTIACLLTAVARITVFGEISIGRFLAVLLLMACSMKGGLLVGAAVGTILGAAMDISGAGVPFYTMVYAFSGLIAGVFSRHGRLLFLLSFCLADAAAVVCAWEAGIHTSPLFECFCAAVVFLLLPPQPLNSLGGVLSPSAGGGGEGALRRHVAGHVLSLSQAYSQLFEAVERGAGAETNDADISKVFDRAAGAVCAACASRERCWSARYADTLGAMNDATQAMLRRGTLELSDLPEHFVRSCEKPEGFVSAVNFELRARECRTQFRSRLGEMGVAAVGQYAETASVLRDISKELQSVKATDALAARRLVRYLKSLDIDADTAVFRDAGGRLHAVIESGRLTPLTSQADYLDKLSAVLGVRLCRPRESLQAAGRLTLVEAEPLAVSVGIAARKKKGEKVSGDRGTYFKTDSGVLCVILSDGMGCGDEAARESAQCVSILEKFLRAGVAPVTAMQILNSVMLLKGSDDWGFATVDLMSVDLFTGETCFYKYGAAPSYVMSGKGVRRIEGESLAAGLGGGGAGPDVVRMKLKPGATAVIASDGVIADGDDEWLKDILAGERADMKSLARRVIARAAEHYGEEDDMTVLAVKVEARE